MAQSSTAIRAIKRDVPFLWEGKDKRGKVVKGRMLAKDELSLRAQLRQQGVAASRIKKQSVRTGGKVKPADIAVFSRQLATMMAAGIPLVQSFDIVGAGHDNPAMQKLILDIKQDVEGGMSLHEALGQASAAFRRPVREPGRSRRAGRRAGEPAGQDRHLQGKDRSAEEQGQEGAVLSRRRHGRGHRRYGDPADLRDPAVRGPVQGLRRGPAGIHAAGHQPVAIRADQGLSILRWCWPARSGPSFTSRSARARCANCWIAWR